MSAPYGNLPPPQPRFSRPTLSAGKRLLGASLRRMFFLFVWFVVILGCVPWVVYDGGRAYGYFRSDAEKRNGHYHIANGLAVRSNYDGAWAELMTAKMLEGPVPSDFEIGVLQARILAGQGHFNHARVCLDKFSTHRGYPEALAQFKQLIGELTRHDVEEARVFKRDPVQSRKILERVESVYRQAGLDSPEIKWARGK